MCVSMCLSGVFLDLRNHWSLHYNQPQNEYKRTPSLRSNNKCKIMFLSLVLNLIRDVKHPQSSLKISQHQSWTATQCLYCN